MKKQPKIRPADTPNEQCDFVLEKDQADVTRWQLVNFKPEAFDPERLIEGILGLIDDYLQQKIYSRLSKENKLHFDEFKNHLLYITSVNLSNFLISFDVQRKQPTSNSLNSPTQHHSVDVVIKNQQQLLQAISWLFEYIEQASSLLSYITQIEDRITTITDSLRKAYSRQERLQKRKTLMSEESSDINNPNKVTSRKSNARLAKITTDQQTVRSTISKKEANLQKMQTMLKEVNRFLILFLDNGAEQYTFEQELQQYTQELDTPDTDDTLKTSIEEKLSEPYAIQYSTFNEDKQYRLDIQQKIGRVRTLIEKWEIRFAIIALLGAGIWTVYKATDQSTTPYESDVVSSTLTAQDRLIAQSKILFELSRQLRKREVYQIIDNDLLSDSDRKNILIWIQNDRDFTQKLKKYMLEYPFVAKYFTQEQRDKISAARTENDITTLTLNVRKYFKEHNDFRNDIATDVANLNLKPTLRSCDCNRPECNSVYIRIPQSLINLLGEQFSELELEFYVGDKGNNKPSDQTAFFTIDGHELVSEGQTIDRYKNPWLYMDVYMIMPANIMLTSAVSIPVGQINIPKSVQNKIDTLPPIKNSKSCQ